MPANNTMVSEVSICNQALSWLGQSPISSLDDKSTTAEWMRNNYPFIRDAVLEEGMWTFATVRAESTSGTKAEWGGVYVHPKPFDWLSVFRVYPSATYIYNTTDVEQVQWRYESGNVVCADTKVYLWGIRRVTDTGKFSALFIQALAARIAADAAIPMTENRLLQADMWALYNGKLDLALARDGMQGRMERARARILNSVR